MPRQKSVDLRIGSLGGLLLALGCLSYQEVRVVSNPPGAEVFVDQVKMGITPLQVRLMRDRDHSVYVKKDSFTPELVVVTLRTATQDGRKFLTPADVFVDLLARRDSPEGGEGGPATDGDRDGVDPGDGSASRDRPERDRRLRITPPEGEAGGKKEDARFPR
jgi:hypothetical protein